MPVRHCVNSARQLIIYSALGHCTGLELLAAEEETRRDPKRQPGMRILLDLREVKDLDFSLDDLNRGVEMNNQLDASGWELEKTAVVIRSAHDEIAAELYDELTNPNLQLKMATFKTLESALEWLGLAGQRDDVERLIQGLRV